MYIEVLTDNGLTQEQWEDGIFKEYIGQLPMKHLMGTSSNAVIQVKEDLAKKVGDAITMGIRSKVVGGKVTGRNKGIGNEGTMRFYNQRIVIDNVRYLVKIEDIPMTQKRVGFDVLKQAREGLEEKGKEGTEDDIIVAATDTSRGRVRGRYLYGGTDANWNATHATALTAVDNTDDQLTGRMISVAKRKAQIPINALTKMRPMKVKGGQKHEEWFVFYGHNYSVRDLRDNDAAFRNAQLLLPPQSNRDSPLYSGSSFKGAWDGVLIYEYDRMPLLASTIQVSHNLLMGAQALAMVWGQRSKFGEESQDLGHDRVYEIHEIRGIEKIVWNRDTQEDNGIINVFAAAVAD